MVNLSFDLVNNVESWRQLPPPLVSRASPYPHKTFMKPVINRPDKEEGSRFQKSAAPLRMPSLPPMFLYLKSKHKPSIPTGCKVSEQRVSPNPEISRICLESYPHSEITSPPLAQILCTDRGGHRGARQSKGLGQSDHKSSVTEK